jgi:hypothetical protein
MNRFGGALAALTATLALAAFPEPGYGQTAVRRLYVAASNDQGAQVLDLNASEFELREGGQRRDISRCALVQRPMRIALLVDTSGSGASIVQQMRAALRAFFDAVDPQHEIVLITTGGMLRVRVPPTTDREKLKTESDRLFTDGSNVLLSAVVESYNRFLRSGEFYPILAIVTLGDLGSGSYPDNPELDRLGRAIRSNGGTVLGAVLRLLPGDRIGGSLDSAATPQDRFGDVDICHTLATATDGACLETMSAAALQDTTRQLAARINESYRHSSPVYELEYTGAGKGAPQIQVTRSGLHAVILSSR